MIFCRVYVLHPPVLQSFLAGTHVRGGRSATQLLCNAHRVSSLQWSPCCRAVHEDRLAFGSAASTAPCQEV